MVNPLVSIIMGSDSDLPVMNQAAEILISFGVPYEITIVSAHRTPKRLFEFSENAHKRGIEVIIAGAGGAAHLPGMVAAISPLPVIGVPIKSSNSIDGWDSILSILQMPGGVPVATVALNGAKNAGLLAVQILSVGEVQLRKKMLDYKSKMDLEVMEKVTKLKNGVHTMNESLK
jgi:5-(carboxyamino)imidazole ribonucleotide mutase